MPDQTLNPTVNTTPDIGGTSAVTSPSNTGHGSTTCFPSGGNTVERTCRWSAFQSASQQPSKITLLVDWTENGAVGGAGSNAFSIDYSTNNGSSWTGLLAHSNVSASNNGTASVSLSPSQNISQIQVRDDLVADRPTTPDTASITCSVSSIRLEIEFGSNKIILGMM